LSFVCIKININLLHGINNHNTSKYYFAVKLLKFLSAFDSIDFIRL
jgi:hypothetical protein